MKHFLWLWALPALAAVDGTVVNRTTGKPAAAATVTIYKLGQDGMESLESVKSDAQGKFTLTTTPAGGGPHLIQAAFEGVTYNRMMPPGSPTTGVEVEVFNAAKVPTGIQVKQHFYILEPLNGKLNVAENLVFENTGKMAYVDPAGGSMKFFLPPEANGKVRVMCEGPRSMPIERAASLSKQANVYQVDFPIKPGETRFQMSYEMPLGTPPVWAVNILHKEGETRLAAPSGVTLKGEGIRELGREPRTQAAIYETTTPNIKVEVEGTGSLRDASGAANDDAPSVEEIKPRIYDRLYVVLGLAAAILALGFVLIYRMDSRG